MYPDGSVETTKKHCLKEHDVKKRLVKRFLGAAVKNEYVHRIHQERIAAHLEDYVERKVIPHLVDIITNPDPKAVVHEGRGRPRHPKDLVTTSPADDVYRDVRAFVRCMYQGTIFEQKYAVERRRTVQCLIALGTIQKGLNFEAMTK